MLLEEDDSEMLLVLVLLICVSDEADVQVVLCDGVRVLLDLDLLWMDWFRGWKFIVPAMLLAGKLAEELSTRFDSHSSSATSSVWNVTCMHVRISYNYKRCI